MVRELSMFYRWRELGPAQEAMVSHVTTPVTIRWTARDIPTMTPKASLQMQELLFGLPVFVGRYRFLI